MLPLSKVNEFDIDRLRSVLSTTKCCLLDESRAYAVVIEESKLLVITDCKVLPISFSNIDDGMSITHIFSGGGVFIVATETYGGENVQHMLHSYMVETTNPADMYAMLHLKTLKLDYVPLTLCMMCEQDETYVCVTGNDSTFHLYEVTKSGTLQGNKKSEALRAVWNQKQIRSLAASTVMIDFIQEIHRGRRALNGDSQQSYYLVMTFSNGYLYRLMVTPHVSDSTVDTVDTHSFAAAGPGLGVLCRTTECASVAFHLFNSAPSAVCFMSKVSSHNKYQNHVGFTATHSCLSEHLLVGLCSGELGILELRSSQETLREDHSLVLIPVPELLQKYTAEFPVNQSMELPASMTAVGTVMDLLILTSRTDLAGYPTAFLDVLVAYTSGIVCVLRILNLSDTAYAMTCGDSNMSGSLIADNIDIETDVIDGAPAVKHCQWSFTLLFATMFSQKVCKLSQLSEHAGCFGSHVVISTTGGVHVYKYSDY